MHPPLVLPSLRLRVPTSVDGGAHHAPQTPPRRPRMTVMCGHEPTSNVEPMSNVSAPIFLEELEQADGSVHAALLQAWWRRTFPVEREAPSDIDAEVRVSGAIEIGRSFARTPTPSGDRSKRSVLSAPTLLPPARVSRGARRCGGQRRRGAAPHLVARQGARPGRLVDAERARLRLGLLVARERSRTQRHRGTPPRGCNRRYRRLQPCVPEAVIAHLLH